MKKDEGCLKWKKTHESKRVKRRRMRDEESLKRKERVRM